MERPKDCVQYLQGNVLGRGEIISLHEVAEEVKGFAQLLTLSQLALLVHAMKQKFALVSY